MTQVFQPVKIELMIAATQIVSCRNCGAKNRVSLENKRTPVCGNCKKTLSLSDSPLTITDANFNELVKEASLPVLLDFWATWCPPCKMIAPRIDQLAKELTRKAIVGKLDVDKNQKTSARFVVQSIPTLLILKEGKEVDRIVGVESKESILRRLKPFIEH